MMNITFSTDQLTCELKKQFPEVLFAYLFGSAQGGTVREGGDIDLALWISSDADKAKLIPDIVELVEKIIPGAPCDLVFLNDAGDQLAFSVLQGKILFIREEARERHASFYSQTCREYEDTVAWMKKQLQYRGYEVQLDH